MDGTNKMTVVGYIGSYQRARARRAAPGCNCPVMGLTSVFGMDHSLTNRSELYTVEKATSSIWASDLEGCKCRLVVNATGREEELGEYGGASIIAQLGVRGQIHPLSYAWVGRCTHYHSAMCGWSDAPIITQLCVGGHMHLLSLSYVWVVRCTHYRSAVLLV